VRNLSLLALAAVLILAVSFLAVHAPAQNLPAVGQAAPGFTLPSQDGSQISLGNFRGKWVVLYFYPKDMTSGCTIEAHNFQRDLPQFEARNAVILGVSVDSADSHKQFCTKEGLTFRLLSDTNHNVVNAYGSLGNFAGIRIANRNTFLIDPEGRIAKVWTKVNPKTASTDTLAALPLPAGSVKPPAQDMSVKPPTGP
jgi:peroxiredoxin Q/BCP